MKRGSVKYKVKSKLILFCALFFILGLVIGSFTTAHYFKTYLEQPNLGPLGVPTGIRPVKVEPSNPVDEPSSGGVGYMFCRIWVGIFAPSLAEGICSANQALNG